MRRQERSGAAGRSWEGGRHTPRFPSGVSAVTRHHPDAHGSPLLHPEVSSVPPHDSAAIAVVRMDPFVLLIALPGDHCLAVDPPQLFPGGDARASTESSRDHRSISCIRRRRGDGAVGIAGRRRARKCAGEAGTSTLLHLSGLCRSGEIGESAHPTVTKEWFACWLSFPVIAIKMKGHGRFLLPTLSWQGIFSGLLDSSSSTKTAA